MGRIAGPGTGWARGALDLPITFGVVATVLVLIALVIVLLVRR